MILTAVAAAVLAVAQQRPPIPQQLTFVPDRSDGVYSVGEIVGWTVLPGPVDPTYRYKWTIRRNNAVVLKEGSLDLSSGHDRIEIKGEEPEMIYVAIEPTAKLVPDAVAPTEVPSPPPAGPGRGNPNGYTGGNTGRNNGLYAVGAAVAPLKIGLATPRPADFDAFWDGKLAEQAKIPINPALTPAATDTPGVEMSTYVLDALGSHAQGYIAKPAREGNSPCCFCSSTPASTRSMRKP